MSIRCHLMTCDCLSDCWPQTSHCPARQSPHQEDPNCSHTHAYTYIYDSCWKLYYTNCHSSWPSGKASRNLLGPSGMRRLKHELVKATCISNLWDKLKKQIVDKLVNESDQLLTPRIWVLGWECFLGWSPCSKSADISDCWVCFQTYQMLLHKQTPQPICPTDIIFNCVCCLGLFRNMPS